MIDQSMSFGGGHFLKNVDKSMPWGQFRISTGFPLVIVLVCCGFAHAQSGIDADGNAVDPFRASGDKVTVLVFVQQNCPVSGRYAPTLRRISKKYEASAKFWLVFPDKR